MNDTDFNQVRKDYYQKRIIELQEKIKNSEDVETIERVYLELEPLENQLKKIA